MRSLTTLLLFGALTAIHASAQFSTGAYSISGTVADPSGAGTFRAGELWLNTRTWTVKAKDVNSRVGAASR